MGGECNHIWVRPQPLSWWFHLLLLHPNRPIGLALSRFAPYARRARLQALLRTGLLAVEVKTGRPGRKPARECSWYPPQRRRPGTGLHPVAGRSGGLFGTPDAFQYASHPPYVRSASSSGLAPTLGSAEVRVHRRSSAEPALRERSGCERSSLPRRSIPGRQHHIGGSDTTVW